MQRTNKLILALASVVTGCLVGCGGGGGGGGGGSLVQPTADVQLSNPLSIEAANNQALTIYTSNAPKLNISCQESTQDYRSITGSFAVDPTSCSTLFLYTNSASGSYSEGVIEFNQDVALPAYASVTMERGTGDTNRPLELKVLGGYIGITPQNGELWYYIYESESHWTGWINSGIPSGSEIAISARQDGKRISSWLNGVRLPDFTLFFTPTDKRFWLKLKGDPGQKSQAIIRTFTVMTESEEQASEASPIATGALPSVAPAATLNLSPQLDFNSEPTIHKLLVRNDSTTTVAVPEIIAVQGGLSRVRNAIHPRSCDKVTQLLPSQECSLFVVNGELEAFAVTQQSAGTAKALATRSATATATRTLVIKTGTTYQTAAASIPVKSTPLRKGYVTGISPLITKQGIRQEFVISGFGLPDTLALDLSGQTCYNSSKVRYDKISCDLNFGTSASVTIKDKPLGSAYSLPALARAVRLSALDYRWPLASTFKEICWDVGQKNPSRSWHTGLDIYATAGSVVFPIANGRVLENRTGAGYGVDSKFLLVDHGGLFAYYGHISSPLRAGDSVVAGQQIGNVVEYTTKKETHLHLSLSNNFSGTVNWGYRSTHSSVLADFESVRPYFANPTLTNRCR